MGLLIIFYTFLQNFSTTSLSLYSGGFWSSLNLASNQLFSHQEETNSGNFSPKKPPMKAVTMNLKRESNNSKKLYKAFIDQLITPNGKYVDFSLLSFHSVCMSKL